MIPGLDSTLNVDPESWFNIKLWPGIWITIQCGIVTRGHDSTLIFDPGSQFHVELWPRVIIPRWNVIPGHDSTLNCYPGQDSTLKFDPGSWFHIENLPGSWFHIGLNSTLICDPESWLNVELWPGLGITLQCGILTRGHNSTWNFDPGSQFNVEFWSVYISTRGIATQDGVKIQQRDKNSTAKEGHNSTKNPFNIDPGSVFNRGVKIYLTPAFLIHKRLWNSIYVHHNRLTFYALRCTISNFSNLHSRSLRSWSSLQKPVFCIVAGPSCRLIAYSS